jgi:hypothetical protein
MKEKKKVKARGVIRRAAGTKDYGTRERFEVTK